MKEAAAGLLFLVTLAILLYLAHLPAWHEHLFTDLNTFYARTDYFIQHGSFSGIVNNEYQPGALIFFSVLSYPLRQNNTLKFFETLFIGANLLLLVVTGIVLYRTRRYGSLVVFSLILLFCGPLPLFRFETLVVLLTILAYLQFKKEKFATGWFWLTLAILTKVYPIFLVPYILSVQFAVGRLKSILVQTAVVALMLTAGLSLYSIAYGQSPREIANSVQFHSEKPIHVESIWATLPTLDYWNRYGTPPFRIYNHGIIGLPPDVISPNMHLLYQLISFICIGMFYVWWLRARKIPRIQSDFVIAILMAINVLATTLAPQYLLWWAFLLPLMEGPRRRLCVSITLVMLALTQYVIPLHYSELIHMFFVNGRHPEVFWVLTIRNILLVSLLCLMGSNLRQLTLTEGQDTMTERAIQ